MCKLAELVHLVQKLEGCSHVTLLQVHHIWCSLIKGMWQQAEDQIKLACLLLEEYNKAKQVDLFILNVLEGVMAVAWGLPKIACQVVGQVKEVAIDVTYKHMLSCCFDET
jgi:hypothetical protein